jgi:hypothetical protein
MKAVERTRAKLRIWAASCRGCMPARAESILFVVRCVGLDWCLGVVCGLGGSFLLKEFGWPVGCRGYVASEVVSGVVGPKGSEGHWVQCLSARACSLDLCRLSTAGAGA